MNARSLFFPAAVTLAWTVWAGCSAAPTDTSSARGVNGGDAGSPSVGADARAPDGAPNNVACPPSWTVTPQCGGGDSSAAPPDFGPNVLIFDPSMEMGAIQDKLDKVYGSQDSDQFGSNRYAYFFKPGKYDHDVKI